MRGLDFSVFHEPESLGLDATTSHPYEPSPAGFLTKIAASLDIRSSDRLLDVGCGKGFALYVLSQFPFGAVDGIEISPRLVRIAKTNLRKLGINSDIHLADVAQYHDLDRYNFFYLSNPFPSMVMKTFLENLKASLIRSPRTAKLLYFNPVCHSLVETYAQKVERHEEYAERMNCGLFVYHLNNF